MSEKWHVVPGMPAKQQDLFASIYDLDLDFRARELGKLSIDDYKAFRAWQTVYEEKIFNYEVIEYPSYLAHFTNSCSVSASESNTAALPSAEEVEDEADEHTLTSATNSTRANMTSSPRNR